jgi:hypothetical protein
MPLDIVETARASEMEDRGREFRHWLLEDNNLHTVQPVSGWLGTRAVAYQEETGVLEVRFDPGAQHTNFKGDSTAGSSPPCWTTPCRSAQ